MKIFKSNGKLLLTGEYVVLDGAEALAVPTSYGQSIHIEAINRPLIVWKSFNELGNIWFETELLLKDIHSFDVNNFTSENPKERLKQILSAARSLNSDFLSKNNGFKVETFLDFPKNWGLGTSSTLINNVAQWANIDAFKLLELTFGGSGYDIACAQYNTAISYKLSNRKPVATPVNFNPSFKDNLHFIYLNKKQNSREGIKHYKSIQHDLTPVISEINRITDQMISCKNITGFQKLMTEHETLISKVTQQECVKSKYFNDFDGAIKSLGAWGGDFILVASELNPSTYFKSKGFSTIIPYNQMVLQQKKPQ